MSYRISELPAGAPPYAATALIEISVANGAAPSGYDSRKALLSDITASQGLDPKAAAQAASTANLTLSGTQTVDGVALVAGNRVLVKNQTAPAANGIYTVAAGAWTRTTDGDSWDELTSAFVYVEGGATNAGSGWQCTVLAGGTLGTTPVTWVQTSGTATLSAGAGLTKTGSQIDVVGTANRIVANADNIDIAATYVGQTSITTVGTLTTGALSGAITGVTQPAATNNTTLATTAFVKSYSANITISDTPPASPSPGDGWWDSVAGTLYLSFNDGTSTQWVPAVNQPGPAGPAGPMGPEGPMGPVGSNWLVGAGLSLNTATEPDTISLTVPVAIASGGTNATTAAGARGQLGTEATIATGTTAQYWRGDKSWQSLNKIAVGLSNVDNTSDLAKPVSTATQTALNLKEATIAAGITAQYWRGDKTWQSHDKASVGLANADNTSDLAKPISTATQTALNLKANLAGPTTFTGTINLPTGTIGVTQVNGTNNTSLATTEFVRQTRLDQLTAPTVDVSWNSRRITGLLDPSLAQDAATKSYVDSTAQGLKTKTAVQAASVGSLTLSGTQIVDGVALVAGNRVLVKNQTAFPANNGIYAVAAGAWTRTIDADAWDELPGAYVYVEGGTQNAGSGWQCTVAAGGTLGTTPVTWQQFSGSAALSAGAGLTKTGSQIDAVGTAGRIVANADSLDIDAAYVGQASITTVGTITTGTWAASTIPVARGGSGATTLTGYLIGNGTSPFTASATIPNTAITGLGTMAVQNASAVAITGGTLAGAVTGVTQAATVNNTTLATTAFVKSYSANITIADTPPASPSPGDGWWDSVNGNLYLSFNDGTSTQWVPAVNQVGQAGPTGPMGPEGPAGPVGSNWLVGTGLSLNTATEPDTISLTVPVTVLNGGTGATAALAARTNLGAEATIVAGTTAQYWRGDKSWQTLNKTAVGLANVDNTSDAAKPISTATQTALNLKEATITAGTITQFWRGDKTWQTPDKSSVGLSNVDNTSDANKPVSIATQTALNLKANLDSPTFTGTPNLPSNTIGITQLPAESSTKLATTAYVKSQNYVTGGPYLPLAGGTLTGKLIIETNAAATLPPTTTATLLQLMAADTGATGIMLDSVASYTHLTVRRANASAAPALINNNPLFYLQTQGHDGTAYTTARIAMEVFTTEAWTSLAQGTVIKFRTTDTGTTNHNLQATIGPGLSVGTAPTAPIGGMLVGDINAERVFEDGNRLARLDNPIFTGAPSLPTGTIGVTQAAAISNTTLATTAYVKSNLPVPLTVALGGTGAVTAPAALIALGAAPATQYVSAAVLEGAALSLTSGTTRNITSVSLAAGDWDVEGSFWISLAGAASAISGWVNNVSLTSPLNGIVGKVFLNFAQTFLAGHPTGARRFSLASTTTIYLSVNCIFTSTATAYGEIRARRAG